MGRRVKVKIIDSDIIWMSLCIYNLSIQPNIKPIPPIIITYIPITPAPDVLPSEFDVISANENFLMSPICFIYINTMIDS